MSTARVEHPQITHAPARVIPAGVPGRVPGAARGQTRRNWTLLLALLCTLALALPSLAPVAAASSCEASGCRHGGGGGGGAIPTEPAAVCAGGFAGSFPCRNVDLGYWFSIDDIGGGVGSDIWGWRHGGSGREFAIMGRSTGTAFVEVTDPMAPVYLGDLPPTGGDSVWHDIKVYADHAFIVSEAGDHGMQVFDLTGLLGIGAPPVTLAVTAHFPDFGNAHNIAINEATGFAYAVGTNECDGGLYMIDISTPAAPVLAGCFDADGYTHDVQCVTYAGPDAAHVGSEICFAANEDSLTIVDVTVKGAPVQLSRTEYAGRGYTHQGWLTDDHVWFLLDDESDELSNKHNARTYIVDVTDLDAPLFGSTYTGGLPVIDHNQYVVGSVMYQAQYTAGLRLVDLTDVALGSLCELGYLDTLPSSNERKFNGAWSVYPFFPSGTVVVGANEGLAVTIPDLGGAACLPDPPIIQNNRQVKCIEAMNKSGIKVAKTQGKENSRCVKDAGRGIVLDAAACITGDLKEKVLKATANTLKQETKRCVADPPTLGYPGGAAVNTAAVDEQQALATDIFGPAINAAIIPSLSDSIGAGCQADVVKFYDKVVQARMKEFLRCKKSGLKADTIVNQATLDPCFDVVLADEKAKILKATSKFAGRVTSKCAGVDLDSAFPGACIGAGSFATCVDERGMCRFCLMLNAMDDLARDCDVFDDTLANGSCPPP